MPKIDKIVDNKKRELPEDANTKVINSKKIKLNEGEKNLNDFNEIQSPSAMKENTDINKKIEKKEKNEIEIKKNEQVNSNKEKVNKMEIEPMNIDNEKTHIEKSADTIVTHNEINNKINNDNDTLIENEKVEDTIVTHDEINNKINNGNDNLIENEKVEEKKVNNDDKNNNDNDSLIENNMEVDDKKINNDNNVEDKEMKNNIEKEIENKNEKENETKNKNEIEKENGKDENSDFKEKLNDDTTVINKEEEQKNEKDIMNNEEEFKDEKNISDNKEKVKGKDEKINKKQKDNKKTITPTKSLRKSKRLIDKKSEVVALDLPTSPVKKTTNKRKRMNADQDLITHQNLDEMDDAENLGKKNPLEIIKKVIGNSDEDVELVVGAQLPVLVHPDINRMKYQLGEIIMIKENNKNNKSTDNKSEGGGEIENSSDEEKGNKKKKAKKGRKSKKSNEVSVNESDSSKTVEEDSKVENSNTTDKDNENNENNNEKLYYIHFINQDKRLDNWRKGEDLWTKKKYPEISNDSSETTQRTTPYLYIPDGKGKLTRSMKRKYGIINESLQSLSEIDPKLAALEKEREEITKVKNIEKVQFGNYLLNAWYFAPYPNEYKCKNKLYICDHCMKYMKYESTLIKHRKECPMTHPPGILVYEKDNLRVYEIDGKKEKLYCQNFCLLSKLFLDHKTVYYDIEPFLFYVLTEKKIENGKEIDHVMGYFSKEKRSFDNYNLACILVLPPYQRKGYGHFLIEFSYELSKRENIIGSPEKPLSDLGLVSYRTYWQSVLLRIIKDNPKMNFTLRELSLLTSIRHEDIVSTLGSMNMLKYWKGEHSLCVTPKMVEEFLAEHHNIKLDSMVDPSLIHDTYITEPIQSSTLNKKKYVDLTKG